MICVFIHFYYPRFTVGCMLDVCVANCKLCRVHGLQYHIIYVCSIYVISYHTCVSNIRIYVLGNALSCSAAEGASSTTAMYEYSSSTYIYIGYSRSATFMYTPSAHDASSTPYIYAATASAVYCWHLSLCTATTVHRT